MIPNWMIPNSRTTKIGRTMANSVIVCPFSFLIFSRFISGSRFEVRGAPAARGGPPRGWPSCLRQQPRHVGDSTCDCVTESCEEEKRARHEDREDEGVLRHRLTRFGLATQSAPRPFLHLVNRHRFSPRGLTPLSERW